MAPDRILFLCLAVTHLLLGLTLAQQQQKQPSSSSTNDRHIDSFSPSLVASCVGGTMWIRVDTQDPFEGIIHGPNRTEPGCSVLGHGGLKTELKIDLTKAEGQPGRCGVKYNERTEERRVAIAVRAHATIELLQDKLFVVTCGPAGFQNSRNQVSVVQLRVTPPGDHAFKVGTVLEGSLYNLRAEVVDHDPKFGILVRRCFAFDESDNPLQLVDDRGCVIEKLISNFVYDNELGTADATIYSMFRLPHSNRTYFQCDVAICRGECLMPDCSSGSNKNNNNNNNRGGGGVLASPLSSSNSTFNSSDPFSKAEDDAVTTSTSVFVAQPGSEAAASVHYCTNPLRDNVSDDWITWLCIALGILFGIMLFINIFLCSAMTCSCTRSEIVEKEPSIYDDYSLYDSQYGYTNDKAYGSESDYGSEYGGEGSRGGRGAAAAAQGREAGGVDEVDGGAESDYNSRYSHHGGGGGGNSTMGRSRR